MRQMCGVVVVVVAVYYSRSRAGLFPPRSALYYDQARPRDISKFPRSGVRPCGVDRIQRHGGAGWPTADRTSHGRAGRTLVHTARARAALRSRAAQRICLLNELRPGLLGCIRPAPRG